MGAPGRRPGSHKRATDVADEALAALARTLHRTDQSRRGRKEHGPGEEPWLRRKKWEVERKDILKKGTDVAQV